MKIIKNFVIVVAVLMATVSNAQTPPLEGSWEIIPELTDDFEGNKLDDTKWIDKNPLWDGRHPSYFEPKNVSLENGQLLLKSRQINDQDRPPFLGDKKRREKGEYTHAVAAVTSKIKVKYGYFEIKCKPGNSKFWSSFWFYNATPENWTEIDVFEIVASEKYILRTAHLFRSPTYEGTINDHIRAQQEIFHPTDRLTSYHTYALDWNREKITWYVDGIEVFSAKNEHWHHELYMFFDTQVSPEWPDIPKPGVLPVEFNIEYIRSWKKTPDTRGSAASVSVVDEMIQRANQDNRFHSSISSSYRENLGWVSGWELRWLDFNFSENRVVRIFHATNKQDSSMKYTIFYDPSTSAWTEWI